MSLVIKRKPNEAVWIGGVLVRVLSSGPGKAKIEIIAPPEVEIARDELLTPEQRKFRASCFARFAARFRKALSLGGGK
jgi:sRNA-binding carbon storage regulator CsrA